MAKSSPPVAASNTVTDNCWTGLKRYTDARIGLGRSGQSLPTQAHLEFQLAHARARDAVHLPLIREDMLQQLSVLHHPLLWLHSQASHRSQYLQRPDLGRRLASESLTALQNVVKDRGPYDVAVVIADGLSSLAVLSHGKDLLQCLLAELSVSGLKPAPIAIVQQGRVAIGDEIAEQLHCRFLIMIIGERPGLSSPDSLGIYYTYQAKVGLTDEARNCISNIRPGGLSNKQAVNRLMWLIGESATRGLSGVNLKDKSAQPSSGIGQAPNFLLD